MNLFGQEFPPEDNIQTEQKENDNNKNSSLKRWLRTSAMILATQLPSIDASAKGETEAEKSAKEKLELAYEGEESSELEGKTFTYEKKEGEEGVIVIELENKFETDKATVSPENIDGIKKNLIEIWEGINQENVDGLLGSKITIEASADPDMSSYVSKLTGKVGNIALAEDRAMWLKNCVRESLEGYDFSQSGLSENIISRIKSVPIEINTPPDGVRQLTEIENPETGKNYTESEIANLSSSELERVKQEARIAKVIFEQKETISHTGELSDIFEIAKGSDSAYIFFDNSASMQDNDKLVETARKESRFENQVFYGTFSDTLDPYIKNAETLKIKDVVITGKGNPNERIFTATKDALENIKMDSGKNTMIFLTDEDFQRGSVAGIKALVEEAENKNVDVLYGITNKESNEVSYFTLSDILAYARQEYTEGRRDIQIALQKEIGNYQEEMKKLPQTNPKYVEYEKLIKKNQEKIEDMYSMSSDELKEFLEK